ncbi:MAG: hypothetical protein CTY12_00075 [Methylotenera sp.]|nr:MAG: hypothetical protein CTY12_00075 [Methylotenera sp.]
MTNIKTIKTSEAVTLLCDKMLQNPQQLILVGLLSHHQVMAARTEILEQLQEHELCINRSDRIVTKNDSCVLIKIANEVFGRGYSLDMLILDKNIPELEACLWAHLPTVRNIDNLYLLED